MRTQDIIAAKRDGQELAEDQIRNLILNYTIGRIPDYQMSAFLMAVYLKGLNFRETSIFTQAMVDSGATLDLSSVSGTKVDKHSTGGVGDKTTLVVVPILAARGLKAPKMSGRGLGFTGGTLDKLESIPGFNTALPVERFVNQVKRIGAAIAGQTADIVPADKKIYALRDVTATVESIPLIAASVMSKKIACASDIILLDVKVGSGAFMHDIGQARELARTMIAIGRNLGRKTGAVITDMNQPLGKAVGNALEVREAIDTLQGLGPVDFTNLCVQLSGIMLYMAAQCKSVDEGRDIARATLDTGAALEKFTEIVQAQDGDPRIIDDPSLLPAANHIYTVTSLDSGVVTGMDTARIGVAASVLGAGREKKEDGIDPAVGVIIEKKLGNRVEKGEALAVINANNPALISQAEFHIRESYAFGDPAELSPFVPEIIF